MIAPYQFLAHAKKSFAFLVKLGFRVEYEHEGTYASFKDGFEVAYTSQDVNVLVAYYDMELEITFKKGRIAAPYLFLDHNLHANVSGLAGCMFSLDKLGAVIDRVAKDIETHYEDVLRGDAAVWQKVEKLVLDPKEKKRFLP